MDQINEINVTEGAPALPTDERKTVDATAENSKKWTLPEFKVSGVFSSHMVLQREKPIRIRGFSDTPHSKVSGCFDGETVVSEVGDDGRWELKFCPRPYNREGQPMVIADDRGHQTVMEDILIGDVWLIGGQSNAELNLAPCMTLTPSLEFYEDEAIRLFTQTQAFVYTNQDYCLEPQPDIINPDWCWKRPSEEAARAFSAMGFYFAREVSKHVDVPLGMVMMAAGGACIRELLPENLAHGEGYFFGANVRESGYYNTLIHPFCGLPCKGMLFFQGESEGGDRTLAEKYTYELALLVADERQRFGWEFPFYNVQLSDYRAEGAQFFPWHDVVRVKQYEALSVIPNSTLTVDMDLGSPEDWPDWAHSPRKLELAERLAALALAREYNVKNEREVSSPTPAEVFLSADQTKIVVEFTNVGAGLIVSGQAPVESLGKEVAGFSVGDYDHRTPAKATITSRCAVTVEVPEGVEPTHVNYAYFLTVTPENANLRGGNNLPVPAFSLKIV